MKNDRYFISILDYMIVGDDDSSTIDDKPRPKGRRLSLFLRSVFLKIFAKKVFEWDPGGNCGNCGAPSCALVALVVEILTTAAEVSARGRRSYLAPNGQLPAQPEGSAARRPDIRQRVARRHWRSQILRPGANGCFCS